MDISEDELFRFRLDSGRYDPSGPIELAGTSDDDEKEEVNVRNPRSPSLDEVRDFMGKHEKAAHAHSYHNRMVLIDRKVNIFSQIATDIKTSTERATALVQGGPAAASAHSSLKVDPLFIDNWRGLISKLSKLLDHLRPGVHPVKATKVVEQIKMQSLVTLLSSINEARQSCVRMGFALDMELEYFQKIQDHVSAFDRARSFQQYHGDMVLECMAKIAEKETEVQAVFKLLKTNSQGLIEATERILQQTAKRMAIVEQRFPNWTKLSTTQREDEIEKAVAESQDPDNIHMFNEYSFQRQWKLIIAMFLHTTDTEGKRALESLNKFGNNTANALDSWDGEVV